MKSLSVALFGAALLSSTATAQLDPVEVQGGRVAIDLFDDALAQLGIQVLELNTTAAVGTPGEEAMDGDLLGFSIAPGADLKVLQRRADEEFQAYGVLGGGVNVEGGFTLRSTVTGNSVDFHGFRLHAEDVRNDGPGGAQDPDYFFLSSAADPTAGDFLLCYVKVLFSPDEGYQHEEPAKLRVKAWDMVASPELADKLGHPELVGKVLGYGKLDADVAPFDGDWQHPAGQNIFTPQTGDESGSFSGGFLDVKLGILSSINDLGHVGTFPNGRTGMSMSTTSCNVGDVNVTWLAAMNENHPGITMQLYRELDGRFEMVGTSWVKHGFFALSNSQCTQCQNPSPGTFLGVGCSDTYANSNNGDRFWLGPRDEWDAFTGEWTCLGSYFDGTPVDCVRDENGNGNGPVNHRLESFDYDLGNPGATYYYEANYLVIGDQDLNNNIGSRRCTMSWNGSSWNFSTPGTGNNLVEGPAILRWGDDHATVGLGDDDGDVVIGVNVTDNLDGTWTYDYTIFNWTMDRMVRSFSVPSGPLASDFHFHDIDDQAANDWAVSTAGKNVTWTFPDVFLAGHKVGGPLELNNAYSFGFTSNKAPSKRFVELGIHESGAGGDLLGASILAPGTLQMTASDLAPAEGETPNLIVRGGTVGALMAVIGVNGAPIPPVILTPTPVPFTAGEASFPLNIPVGVSGLTFDLLGADFDTSVIELSNVGRIAIQ